MSADLGMLNLKWNVWLIMKAGLWITVWTSVMA
jgi:hypothetical protein